MISISLCMIVKDEEEVLSRCLDCFKNIVDEIIIVDTGSIDKTKEIAKKYTDKIYNFEWVDDFAKARNYSFSKASKEYILWMDADEVIDEENQKKLIYLKKNLSNKYDLVTMETLMGLDDKGNPTLKFKRNRLVKASKEFKWYGFIHEYISVYGEVFHSDIGILEKKIKNSGDRNLRIYKRKIEEGVNFDSRDLNYYGKELFYNGLYDESVEILLKFIDLDVWSEDKVDAICKISDCYSIKKEYEKAREILYKSFEFITPRAEVIYRIGQTFEHENKYEEAIYWYESIQNITIPSNCYGFLNPHYWNLSPYIQLCVCYYKIGDIEKAIEYHNKCMEINPDNYYVKYNNDFFESL